MTLILAHAAAGLLLGYGLAATYLSLRYRDRGLAPREAGALAAGLAGVLTLVVIFS